MWFCPCFLHTSVLLLIPHILWKLLHKSLSGSRELLQQILLEPWSQHGGQEGQEAQSSWFQSRSLPAQAVWFTLPLSQSKNGLSVFASSDPHRALPPREFTALGCKCPGILCRSPCSQSGTFQLLTGAVSPCRAASSSWDAGGQAGLPRVWQGRMCRFCFGEGPARGSPRGRCFPGRSSHLHRCAVCSAGHQPKMLSLACPGCPA